MIVTKHKNKILTLLTPLTLIAILISLTTIEAVKAEANTTGESGTTNTTITIYGCVKIKGRNNTIIDPIKNITLKITVLNNTKTITTQTIKTVKLKDMKCIGYNITITVKIQQNITIKIEYNNEILNTTDINVQNNTIKQRLDLTIPDTVPPILKVLEPGNGSWVGGGVVVGVCVGDDLSGVESVSGVLRGGDVGEQRVVFSPGSGGGCGGSMGYYTARLEGLGDGQYTLRITARDRAGNSNTVALVFGVDTQPPKVAIEKPVEGEALNTTSVELVFTATDTGSGVNPDTIKILVDNKETGATLEQLEAGRWQAKLSLSEGEHKVTVTICDKAGNCGGATVGFLVDTQPPTLRIEGLPSITRNHTVVFTVSSSEPLREKPQVKVTPEPKARPEVTRLNEKLYRVTLRGLGDGEYKVTVTGYDKAGNPGKDEASFRVDTKPPSIEILEPKPGQAFGASGSLTVRFKVWDAGSGVDEASIRVLLDGKQLGKPRKEDNNVWVLELGKTEKLGRGEHSITVEACDVAGNCDSAAVGFLVDTKPPAIKVLEPGDGGVVGVNESIVFRVEVSDEGGVANVTLLDETGKTVEQKSLGGARNRAVVFKLASRGRPGDYGFTIKACDVAGNCANKTVTLRVVASSSQAAATTTTAAAAAASTAANTTTTTTSTATTTTSSTGGKPVAATGTVTVHASATQQKGEESGSRGLMDSIREYSCVVAAIASVIFGVLSLLQVIRYE